MTRTKADMLEEAAKRIEAGKKPYVYIGDCTGSLGRGSFIDYLKQHGDQIPYEDFAELADLSQFEENVSVPLSEDWAVNFYEVETPSGIPAIFFRHSGIEHLFVPRDRVGDFDANEEDRLADELEDS